MAALSSHPRVSLASFSAFSAVVAPAPANPQGRQPSATPGPSLLHAKLVLLRHTAEQVSIHGKASHPTPPSPPLPPPLPRPGVLLVTLVTGNSGSQRGARPGPEEVEPVPRGDHLGPACRPVLFKAIAHILSVDPHGSSVVAVTAAPVFRLIPKRPSPHPPGR